MEPEFDKIIDALLRSSPKDGGNLGASPVHLDADEISAFAENALPPAARSNYIAHFADCGRCRNLLANVIAMNAEDAPAKANAAAAAAPVMTPAEAASAEPWYKWLFRTPNLAAAMGVLVLVFSGFIGYLVLTDPADSRESLISQVADEAPAPSGPNAGEDTFYSANVPAASSNTAANASNANIGGGGGGGRQEIGTMTDSASPVSNIAPPKQTAFSTDGVAAGETLKMAPGAEPASPVPPPPVAKAKEERDTQLAARSADAAISAESQNQNQAQIQNQQIPNARSGPVQSAPAQNRSLGGDAKKRAVTPPTVRQAGGKIFDLRDGVWYDRTYSGQRTTNVRRGSESYKKLDGGLRSIAESIPGVLVVVWDRTAFRIQ